MNREVLLFQPVKDWLERQGYMVYTEIPFYSTSIDVVGRRKTVLIAVELKTSLTKKVIHQTMLHQLFTSATYAAVGTKPRSLRVPTRAGIGVLSVRNGKVDVVLKPNSRYAALQHYVKQMLDRCQGQPSGVGGLPCLDGQGPAQDCKRRVDEYREAHPKATWKELYDAVPNHYSSYKSMYMSLTLGLARHAHFKKIRRLCKAKQQKTP